MKNPLFTLSSCRALLAPWLITLTFGLLGLAAHLEAAIPKIINYQGRVIVGNANFNGTGEFKFSLVDNTGTATFWSNDGIGSGGNEPVKSVQQVPAPLQQGGSGLLAEMY